jgi:hypothetical protein
MGRIRNLGTAICIALLLGAAAAIIALQAWHGPVVLTLSAGHGVDTGDLLAFPLVVLAIAVWRGHARRHTAGSLESPRSRRWAARASAIVLGALLLLAGVVAKAGGGPLVPVGGGTIGGTIWETGGATPFPVDRWSDVAVTYDGATVRLYVDGKRVSSRAATGTIQISRDPLWIGGNRPYGEYFHGRIDELRIYGRALSGDEIRADMAKRVAPARGLVAAYGFDAGAGTTVLDSSGKGNTGTIRGATWTRGRYGMALSFDGTGAVVSVPPSPSLDITSAMTLSGWIRPSAPQSGWRTIVQRQTDAYLLTAGSDRQNRLGRLDDLRAALLVAALVWFCVMIATRGSPDAPGRRHSWWEPAGLFVVGSLADAMLAPSGTLLGPALAASWLGVTASTRAEAVAFLFAAVGLTGLTIASLTHLGSVDVALSPDGGAVARSVALGALFVLAGTLRIDTAS